MTVEHFFNVYVEPFEVKHQIFCGGIERATLSENGRIFRGVGRFVDTPPERPVEAKSVTVPGRYLYAGPVWGHFGHALVDGFHRLWALGEHEGIVFAGVRGVGRVRTEADLDAWVIPAFVEDIMQAIGIRPTRVMLLRRPEVFERLDVPAPGAYLNGDIQPFYRPHLVRYQRAVEGSVEQLTAPKRVYYSRRHLLTRGGILGSYSFESALVANGFTVVRPEELPIVEQFAYILKSEQLVFDEGSSIHLTEVLNEVPPATYMLPRRPRYATFQKALTQRGRFEVLAADANMSLLSNRSGKFANRTLTFYQDPQAVFDRMSELGLVRGAFDEKAYWAAALADLESCPANYPALQQRRMELLRSSAGASLDKEASK